MEPRRVLLTGGSKGIGLGIARRLVAAGARVVTLQRTPGPDAAIPAVPCDLGGSESLICGAVERAIGLLGGVDRLVLAGGAGAYLGWREWKPERAENLLRVNYLGPRLVLHEALRELLRAGRTAAGGRVLWIGSVIAERPGASGLEDYAASKGAAHAFVTSFARHYARLGIRATVLSTGWVDTPMTQAIRDENPALYERIVKAIPLRRMATVEEVAEAAYSILEGPEFWTGEVVRFAAGGA